MSPQSTAAADQITFEKLELMIQTSYEGQKDSLRTTIENALQTAISAVKRHDKEGSLTIQLKFVPAEENGMIDIFADVDTKLPKPKPLPVRLYGTRHGELFPDDPEFVDALPFNKREKQTVTKEKEK